MGLVAVALCATVGGLANKTNSRILPELYDHLSDARQHVDEGQLSCAIAQANLLLISDAKVYVASESREDIEVVAQATAAWEAALNGEMKFTRVNDPRLAQIKVVFHDHMQREGVEVGGYTTWRRAVKQQSDGNWKPDLSVNVELREIQPCGDPMNFRQKLHAAMHEFGHVLGLDDSNEIGDVMGALDLEQPVRKPRAKEIEAIMELRAEAKGLRKSAQTAINAKRF